MGQYFSSNNSVIKQNNNKSTLKASPENIKKMLSVIEEEILPKTQEGVQEGNKVFGAAILNSSYNTVYASTNNEIKCPLLHGEVNTIFEWSKLIPSSERGSAAQSSVFLSTHEPCCMCISSIVWAGFSTVYYFFPYSVTADQGIPWDIETMHELWGVDSYRKENKFCKTACLIDLIQDLDDSKKKEELLEMAEKLKAAYNQLSKRYHNEKKDNVNNNLVLN